jgi:hypothetical protein
MPSGACEHRGKTVFITSTEFVGDLGGNTNGIDGADAVCQAHAASGYVPGTFKAWLGSTSGGPAQRFTQSAEPYRDLNSGKIADNWADLTDGTLDNTIQLDEQRNVQWGEVWTGVETNGDATAGAFPYCGDWGFAMSIPVNHGLGLAESTGSSWTKNSSGICDFTTAHVYCFEQ